MENIKMYFREIGWECEQMVHTASIVDSCEHSNKSFNHTKFVCFLTS